ncbi:MAG TPA: sporulation integral membrane protein YlbJ [Syntrophomonadaceae bacterium]|nr:sporulation integral membrane protein YlbJ [Syntrophomonadaceae bacterium]
MSRKTYFLNNNHKIIAAPSFFTAICLLCAFGVICYPQASFQAAQRGLQTWWEIVFPSLLPFFIIAELLMNLGFVAFLGTLLEPAMRPLFNLPGCSGFIIAVSYLSGFPLCAILSNQLRRSGLCTKNEGERLLSFTSNASPLFMLGAVSIGMYSNPTLGPLIAGIHYLSNLLCGLVLKAFSPLHTSAVTKKNKLFRGALKAFANSSQIKTKSFGQLLGETIRNTSLTMLTIGGFITFFSVLVGILQAAGIFNLLLKLFYPLTVLFNIDTCLLQGIFFGFFEITIGINEISQSSSSLLAQLLAIEVLLAWNGLAIQAQITGMMMDSDLKATKYFLTRLLQIPIAMLITLLVFLLPLEEKLAVTTTSGAGISPLVWGGTLALLSIIFLLGFSLSRCFLNITRKKIIIIR